VAFTASLFDQMSLLEETAAVEDDIDNSVVLASAGRLSTVPSREIHVNIPDTPTDWQPPAQKVDKGEPVFAEVHNPGGWSQFVFRPEFGTTAPKQYNHHSMSTGAQPVPVNPDGKHTGDDWEFFYNGWDEGADGDGGQQGATSEDMFPESRKGELDSDLLETLGLTKDRMVKGDALSSISSFYLCAIHKNWALWTICERHSTARSKPFPTCTLSILGLVDHTDISSNTQFLIKLCILMG
jgi:hypothetical protein